MSKLKIFLTLVAVGLIITGVVFLIKSKKSSKDDDDTNNKLCDPGFYLNISGDCVPNICGCKNGIAVSGSDCVENATLLCSSCNQGYHLKDGECIQNTCTCENGTVASGSNCRRNGHETCSSCNQGYYLDNFRCHENTCLCSNGTPSTGVDCLRHYSDNCKNCDIGWYLENDTCQDYCPTEQAKEAAIDYYNRNNGTVIPTVPQYFTHDNFVQQATQLPPLNGLIRCRRRLIGVPCDSEGKPNDTCGSKGPRFIETNVTFSYNENGEVVSMTQEILGEA